jgi:hypothetical protein
MSGERDPVERVSATAVLVRAVVEAQTDKGVLELIESDLSDGVSGDLEWEWEYTIKVCRGTWVPSAGILAWCKDEDDAAAKQIAMIKSFPAQPPDPDAVPVIVQKLLVTKYTRSPRNRNEAISWHQWGRPRYEEG